MRLGVRLPRPHAMRVLARIILYRQGCPAIGITFTQHRIHRAAFHFVVTRLDIFFFVALGLVGIIGQGITLGLQFFNGGFQLGNGSADVGQLDDIGFRLFRQLTQLSQRIRRFLICGQFIGENGQNPASQRDIACFHGNPGGTRKRFHHGKQGMGCQSRRFIGKGIDNLRSHSFLVNLGQSRKRPARTHIRAACPAVLGFLILYKIQDNDRIITIASLQRHSVDNFTAKP